MRNLLRTEPKKFEIIIFVAGFKYIYMYIKIILIIYVRLG